MTAGLVPSAADTDHAQGPADAPVTLIEYGNYECLHCRRAYPFVEALRAELGGQLRVVFRHYAPPADFPNAERAAEAAEAAAAQGKFWEMHERLMLGPPALHLSALLAQAADLGLDDGRVRDEVTGHVHVVRVREDLVAGVEAGVTSTPTFFVNGVAHAAAWDLESLRASVLAALEEVESER